MILYAKTKHKKWFQLSFPTKALKRVQSRKFCIWKKLTRLIIQEAMGGLLCVEDHWTEHPLSSPRSPHFSMLCFGKMLDSVTKTTKIARELVNVYVSS